MVIIQEDLALVVIILGLMLEVIIQEDLALVVTKEALEVIIRGDLHPIQEDLVTIHKLEQLGLSSKIREYKMVSILAHRTLHPLNLKQVPRVILIR